MQTDVNGVFSYNDGDTITFYVGGIEIGQARGKRRMTPNDLGNSNGANGPNRGVNIARFLQSVDLTPSGAGIDLTGLDFSTLGPIDFDTNFETDSNLSSAISVANGQGASGTLVSAQDAQDHMDAALATGWTTGELIGNPISLGVWFNQSDRPCYVVLESDNTGRKICVRNNDTVIQNSPLTWSQNGAAINMAINNGDIENSVIERMGNLIKYIDQNHVNPDQSQLDNEEFTAFDTTVPITNADVVNAFSDTDCLMFGDPGENNVSINNTFCYFFFDNGTGDEFSANGEARGTTTWQVVNGHLEITHAVNPSVTFELTVTLRSGTLTNGDIQWTRREVGNDASRSVRRPEASNKVADRYRTPCGPNNGFPCF
jgi:hypothetical protein